MEVKRNVMINKAGGTAGRNSVNYRISFPAEMIRAIGITEVDRSVNVKFVDGKIIIEKC